MLQHSQGMSPPKKLTQTTLSFYIKPKAELSSKSVESQPVVKKRSRSATEAKDNNTKKPKLTNKSKTSNDTDSEPEVTSSSEPVQSSGTTVADVTETQCNTLEPYIKLTRCDTPKIEVTSTSTSSEDVIDLISRYKTEISTPKVPDNKLECPEEPDSGIATSEPGSDGTSNEDTTQEDTSRVRTTSHASSDGGVVSDDDNERSLTSPDTLSSPTSADNTSTTPAAKRTRTCVTVSAKKRHDEAKAAAELKRKQREDEKEAKRLQKLEEKAKKDRELEEKKKAKAEQKEAERLAKEAERLAKLKEKEEKQKEIAQKKAELEAKKESERQKREDEKRQKEEEKKQKEEGKRQRDLEKKQKDLEKEQEKQRIEDEKKRKEEARKNHLMKFFKPTKKDSPEKLDKPDAEDAATSYCRFKPFALKADMRMAPVRRVKSIDRVAFDKQFQDQSVEDLEYLEVIRIQKPRTSPDTWPWLEDDDVELVSDSQRHRVKFLQFHTDIRPAYFGTWRQRSRHIRARNPLGQDKQRFDYEVDSADEWEEEEPGESVDSGEEDDEEKDEFDFDPELREEGFLVDHNHLSDGEGGASDSEESLAAKKTKQMIARTYGKRNRKKSKLKPTVYGTVWETGDSGTGVEEDHHATYLKQFNAIVFQQTLPIQFLSPVKKSSPVVTSSANKSATKESQGSTAKKPLPEEAMPDFIGRIHGCMKGAGFIIARFQEFWLEKTQVLVSKAQMKLKMQSFSVYQKRPTYRKSCWYVNEETLSKYGLSDLPVPNTIHKVSTPSKLSRSPATPSSKTNGNTPISGVKAHKSESAQKRLTDFIQPAKKKLKVNDLTASPCRTDNDSPKCKKISLITLTDSPVTPQGKIDKLVKAASDSVTPTSKQVSAPRRVGLTSVPSNCEFGSTAPVVAKAASPRRVSFTTLTTNHDTKSPQKPSTQGEFKTPPKVETEILASPCTNKAPRRIALTSLSSESSSNSVTRTSPQSNKSPRRVPLTTISTPASPSIARSPSTHIVKSPRRVQLTTIQTTTQPQKATDSISKPTLTERSQNTQKIVQCDIPVKTGAL